MSTLTREEVVSLAKKCYHNPQWYNANEFEDDLRIISYIKRQLSSENTNYHLILNHMITMNNVFGHTGTVALLRGSCDEEHYATLNAFFFYLSIIPAGEQFVNIDVIALHWLCTEINSETQQ